MSNNKLKFKANFKRLAPAAFAQKIGIPLGWIVVHYDHIPEKADRRKVHGEWFEISSDKGKIYRMLRFSPNTKKGDETEDTKPAEIVVDWIGWLDLHDRDEDVAGNIDLTLRRVPWLKRPLAYLKHPDPAIRLSGWLGWASVVLGVIALLLALPFDKISKQASALFVHNQDCERSE